MIARLIAAFFLGGFLATCWWADFTLVPTNLPDGTFCTAKVLLPILGTFAVFMIVVITLKTYWNDNIK